MGTEKPDLHDDNYKLVYAVDELTADKINKLEDVKVYWYKPQTKNPLVFLGSNITEAHFKVIELAFKLKLEVIILAGNPINPPKWPVG